MSYNKKLRYSQSRVKPDAIQHGGFSRTTQARKRYADVVPSASPLPPPADDTNPQNWSKATVIKRIKEDLGISKLPPSLRLPQLIRFYSSNKLDQQRLSRDYRTFSVMDFGQGGTIADSRRELSMLMDASNMAARPLPSNVSMETGLPSYSNLVEAVQNLQKSVNVIATAIINLQNQQKNPSPR